MWPEFLSIHSVSGVLIHTHSLKINDPQAEHHEATKMWFVRLKRPINFSLNLEAVDCYSLVTVSGAHFDRPTHPDDFHARVLLSACICFNYRILTPLIRSCFWCAKKYDRAHFSRSTSFYWRPTNDHPESCHHTCPSSWTIGSSTVFHQLQMCSLIFSSATRMNQIDYFCKKKVFLVPAVFCTNFATAKIGLQKTSWRWKRCSQTSAGKSFIIFTNNRF